MYTDQNKQIHLIKWKSIPKNLQLLYSDVFVRKRVPSVGILLHELDAARKKAFARTRYTDLYAPLIARATTPPKTSENNLSHNNTGSSSNTTSQTATKTNTTTTSADTDTETRAFGTLMKMILVIAVIVQLILGTVCYLDEVSTIGEAGLFGCLEHIVYCLFNHTIPEIMEFFAELLAAIFN
jgi:hypothetical protein